MTRYSNVISGQWLISILFFLLTTNPVSLGKVQLIIDTDAGADDAMAILMVLSRSNNINVEAITCVQGNTGVYNVSKNVLKTLQVVDRLDIPVYVGSPSGLIYSEKSDYFFGYDGFGDFEDRYTPSTDLLQSEHPAVLLARKVEENPGLISIMCIGPLTNIAMASLINPNFFAQVNHIFILGGSYNDQGNVGPGIEFNIYADPEAAESFFNRLPPHLFTTLLPFETVMANPFSLKWRMDVLGKLKSSKVAFLNLAERKSWRTSWPNWTPFDQSMAAVLLDPDIVTSAKRGKVVVNTTTNRGYMNVTFGDGPVRIITALDAEKLNEIFFSTLS